VNVPAVDALHTIRRQVEVIRLAVMGLATSHDESATDCDAIAQALDDVVGAVVALANASRLPQVA
jgi:hypothetical protein